MTSSSCKRAGACVRRRDLRTRARRVRQHRRRRLRRRAAVTRAARLSIMAPADPGGGWDETARAFQQAIREGKVSAKGAEVYNVPGAGGTLGLSQLVTKQHGKPDQLMVMGLVMLGAVETNKSARRPRRRSRRSRRSPRRHEAIVVPADVQVPDARATSSTTSSATRPRSPGPAARPAAPTSCSSACWPRRSASTRPRPSTSPTRAAARR